MAISDSRDINPGTSMNISSSPRIQADRGGMEFQSSEPDIAEAVAYEFDNINNLSQVGAKLFSVKNGGTEVFSVGADGTLNIKGNINGIGKKEINKMFTDALQEAKIQAREEIKHLEIEIKHLLIEVRMLQKERDQLKTEKQNRFKSLILEE